ncbi:MAG: sodium:proton antiporter NhaD [Paenirhodobacter sp.]|uniref:sodium:proton antiporter NhaD n=1 Tax=Paenirhodobacter sp. TaxID=1965326 RepID=UPI003D0CEBFD
METLNLTTSWVGIIAVLIFVGAYVLVILEEATHMRKSKPVMLAAGLIWGLIGIAYMQAGLTGVAHEKAIEIVEEYGELFLFLLVAITYVNTMEERHVFDVLRAKLVGLGLTYRKLFWVTGLIAFFLSGVLDNLTTSLVMGAVVMAVGKGHPKFVATSFVSLVVAANAGGAFTPFGDITTLMVWQKGVIEFFEFFDLLIPSALNWLVPALIMSFVIPNEVPADVHGTAHAKPGAGMVVVLFFLTIVTSICFKNFLALPPALGMMLGLGYMQIYSYFLTRKITKRRAHEELVLDAFKQFEQLEWDTLLFFFGIIFAVGGLGVLGYLDMLSTLLYQGLGATAANSILGAMSAIIDNIPLMFAVLTMDPDMSHGQWLLITLTCGVGGSLLSIGSAAGVALMGQARGVYTFTTHLKWTWAIALGYFASIGAHLLLNADLFDVVARAH